LKNEVVVFMEGLLGMVKRGQACAPFWRGPGLRRGAASGPGCF
jgi:hypothetical protein